MPRPVRGLAHRLAFATLALLVAGGGCLKNGGGSSGGGSTAPGQTANAPALVGATFVDRDGSGDATAGDVLVLQFDAPVDASAVLAAIDLPLYAPGDSLGIDPTVTGPGPSMSIEVTLGQAPRLSLTGTYVPNDQPNGSPAAIAVAQGAAFRPAPRAAPAVPIVAAASTRFTAFHGRTYPVTTTQHAYYGQLHAHTSYSDGELLPSDACQSARAAGLDFFGVTDHLEQIVIGGHWSSTLPQMDAANQDGQFVTITGYEWGGVPTPMGWVNHVNVVGTRDLIPVFSIFDVTTLYREIGALPDDAIGIFNHPYYDKPIPVNQWDDYAYHPEADSYMTLIQAQAGVQNDTIGYIPLLDHGWHVSPQWGEDNHHANWGSTPVRMGVYAEALTRHEILRALREMRTFTTGDANAAIALVADDRWAMGSTLGGPGAHVLSVRVDDPDAGDGFGPIEIVSLGGQVVAQGDAGGQTSFRWDLVVDPAGDRWYYARAYQADGALLISGPIFVDR